MELAKAAPCDDRAIAAQKDSAEAVGTLCATGALTVFWYVLATFVLQMPSLLSPGHGFPLSYLPALSCLIGIMIAYESSLRGLSLALHPCVKRLTSFSLLVVGVAFVQIGFLQGATSAVLTAAGGLCVGISLGVDGISAMTSAVGLGRRAFVVCLGISMALGSGALLLCFSMDANAMPLFLAAALLVGQCCSLCLVRFSRQAVSRMEFLDFKTAYEKMALHRRTGWYLLLYGCAVSLKSAFMLTLPDSLFSMAVFGAGVGFACGAVGSFVGLMRCSGAMVLGIGQRVAFPLLVVGLIPWEQAYGPLVALSYACLFAGCAVFVVLCRDTHCFLAETYQVAPVHPLTIGFRQFVRGSCAGAIIFAIAFTVDRSASAAVIVALVLVVALSVVLAFVKEEPDRVLDAKEDAFPLRAGRWKRCALALAEEYLLTARETDILLLLLKTHTIERIGDTLCISAHTVKTHVYHIYQKLGISSRGELSEIFESRLEALKRD